MEKSCSSDLVFYMTVSSQLLVNIHIVTIGSRNDVFLSQYPVETSAYENDTPATEHEFTRYPSD